MSNRGRRTKSEKEVFDKQFAKAYEDYRSRFFGPRINVDQLIRKYDLQRGGRPLKNKQWSAELTQRRLISQKRFIRETVVNTFLDLMKSGVVRHKAIESVAHKVGREIHDINTMLRTSGYGSKKNQRKATGITQKSVLEKFNNGESVPQIAESEAISRAKVLQYLRSFGLDDSQINYAQNAVFSYRNFRIINIENAHLLGIIWSDGSINNGYDVTIRLNNEDRSYLESFSKSLVTQGSKHPKIGLIETREGARFSKKPQAGLSICRRNFVKYLEHDLGLPKNKEVLNHGLPEPILKANDALFFAFLRGFYEGDGHQTQNSSHPSVGFACTSRVADELKIQLAKRLSLSLSKAYDKSNTYRVVVAGISSCLLLLLNIYRHSGLTPVMERKFSKACILWDKYSAKIFGKTSNFEEVM